MSNDVQRSDPDGLRAGVERLITEWEHNERTLRPYDESTAQVLHNHVRELRALLAKHPPTPPTCDACGFDDRSNDPKPPHTCASPPSEPSPVEQEN